MTNTHHNKIKNQRGITTLLITVILLVTVTLLVFFTAQYGIVQLKMTGNQYRSKQAYQASEAGLEYGLAYLNQNSATITQNNPVNTTVSGSVANGATFSVTMTSPNNNTGQITITSTGTNGDGSTTHTISQITASGSPPLTYTITTQGSIIESGSFTVGGTNSLDVGGSILTSGSANVTGTITSPDVPLAAMTSAALFQKIFSTTQATEMASAQSAGTYYPAASVNYAQMNGGGTFWIQGNLVNSSSVTMGTPAKPVIVIVNGNFTNSGTLTVNGILYVMGATTASGSFSVTGAMVSQGNITLSGQSYVYNANIVKQLLGGSSYNKVPGSWKDF